MTTQTQLHWAELLTNHLTRWYRDHGHGDVVGLIGDPVVSVPPGPCDGVQVHVNLGSVFRCEEPWPSARRETVGVSGRRVVVPGAAELTVRVLTCVPVLDEGGRVPGGEELVLSGEHVAGVGWLLFGGLVCAEEVFRPVWGRLAFGRVEALGKSGGRTGWECLVTVPVCDVGCDGW